MEGLGLPSQEISYLLMKLQHIFLNHSGGFDFNVGFVGIVSALCRNTSSLTTVNSTEGILNGLYNCSPELLSEITGLQWPEKWPYVTVRRPGKCETSNLRVVKTIRVREKDLEPWIAESDIKARWSKII